MSYSSNPQDSDDKSTFYIDKDKYCATILPPLLDILEPLPDLVHVEDLSESIDAQLAIDTNWVSKEEGIHSPISPALPFNIHTIRHDQESIKRPEHSLMLARALQNKQSLQKVAGDPGLDHWRKMSKDTIEEYMSGVYHGSQEASILQEGSLALKPGRDVYDRSYADFYALDDADLTSHCPQRLKIEEQYLLSDITQQLHLYDSSVPSIEHEEEHEQVHSREQSSAVDTLVSDSPDFTHGKFDEKPAGGEAEMISQVLGQTSTHGATLDICEPDSDGDSTEFEDLRGPVIFEGSLFDDGESGLKDVRHSTLCVDSRPRQGADTAHSSYERQNAYISVRDGENISVIPSRNIQYDYGNFQLSAQDLWNQEYEFVDYFKDDEDDHEVDQDEYDEPNANYGRIHSTAIHEMTMLTHSLTPPVTAAFTGFKSAAMLVPTYKVDGFEAWMEKYGSKSANRTPFFPGTDL